MGIKRIWKSFGLYLRSGLRLALEKKDAADPQRIMTMSSFAESLSGHLSGTGLPYLTNVPRSTHLALFWEDDNAARLLEFWYLLHSLVRREHCICTTHGELDFIRNHTVERGSDIDYYEKRLELLHILQIDDQVYDPEGH